MAGDFPICETGTQPDQSSTSIQYLDPPELQVCEEGDPPIDEGKWSEIDAHYFNEVTTQPQNTTSSGRNWASSVLGFLGLISEANATDVVKVCTPGSKRSCQSTFEISIRPSTGSSPIKVTILGSETCAADGSRWMGCTGQGSASTYVREEALCCEKDWVGSNGAHYKNYVFSCHVSCSYSVQDHMDKGNSSVTIERKCDAPRSNCY